MDEYAGMPIVENEREAWFQLVSHSLRQCKSAFVFEWDFQSSLMSQSQSVSQNITSHGIDRVIFYQKYKLLLRCREGKENHMNFAMMESGMIEKDQNNDAYPFF
ncbi:hypothetical protein JTB14_027330 [Gonioctena quinquepunctata]|nr:hypothetical protein JTB14_027330 [Gonioctena quinquepunctata]